MTWSLNPEGVNRTISVTTNAATYTAAQQTTDGLTGDGFTATVYQKDVVRGRGQPASIVVGGDLLDAQLAGGDEPWHALMAHGTREMRTL